MLSALSSSLQRALTLLGAVYLIAIAAILILLCIALFFLSRMLLQLIRLRGRRYVLCPGTGRVAIIEIDLIRAGVSGMIDDPKLIVRDCTNWPARRECHQGCLQQMET